MSRQNSDVLVSLQGVRKKFCRSLKHSLLYGLKDLGREVLGRATAHDHLRPEEFWAVDDVSLDIRRGECVGLIGRNGAGKTTLLKMLNGLIKPDAGQITIRGQTGALIALGAGFNPILCGRENIYVNASILGLTKHEIDEKVDEIIDFAEIAEFIDAPVQSYSSGMSVRLGFAVATALNPDVLLVDEVLAVGDIGFRSKCYDRLERLRPKTATIIISHNRQDIARTCSRGVVLQSGRMTCNGSVSEAFNTYDLSFRDAEAYQHCQEGLELVDAKLNPTEIAWRGSTRLTASIMVQREFRDVQFRVSILDHGENCVAEWRSENHLPPQNLHPGVNDFAFDLGTISLESGVYSCNFVCAQRNVAQYLILSYRHMTLRVNGTTKGLSPYQL